MIYQDNLSDDPLPASTYVDRIHEIEGMMLNCEDMSEYYAWLRSEDNNEAKALLNQLWYLDEAPRARY